MTNSEFGVITLQLFLLIALAHLLGYWFAKLRQPKVIGEILAGIIVGPSILGHFAPGLAAKIFPQLGSAQGSSHDTVLMFLYNLGLLLLMFASGAETRGLFQPQDRRQITWLALVGTGAPFVIALACSAWIPTHLLETSPRMRFPVLLVVSIAVAVTSIPVISKILHDLGILHTRFSRLVLGVAVIEDIALWAVLAIATAAAASSNLPELAIVKHIAITILYFATAMLLMPRLLRWLADAKWNILSRYSAVGYLVLVLLAYSALAAVMDVSLVFAAFLAGFGVACDAERYSESLDVLKKLSFAVFIPVYFAVVGYKLDLSKTFSLSMLVVFMLIACVLKLISAGAGARIAGFSWPSSVNLAVATNARGGPGIVLASVAFDAGIINAQFYTTLVLTAVLTSQFAGAWLDYILRKGMPLLTEEPVEKVVPIAVDEDLAA
ncbi:MAG: cation:proton antiporter [Acidobacteriaceae bacterium]